MTHNHHHFIKLTQGKIKLCCDGVSTRKEAEKVQLVTTPTTVEVATYYHHVAEIEET
jgi:hypothetical protein